MKPGADHQDALVCRILLFDRVINAHRAVKIFGIKPARDIEDGMPDVFEILKNILCLPVFVVVAVLHVFVPGGDAVVEIFFIHVGERTQF